MAVSICAAGTYIAINEPAAHIYICAAGTYIAINHIQL
jgi:hypothetical protein